MHQMQHIPTQSMYYIVHLAFAPNEMWEPWNVRTIDIKIFSCMEKITWAIYENMTTYHNKLLPKML